MLKSRRTILIVSILLLALAGYYIYYRTNPVMDAETIALVNGEPITRLSFEERLSSIKMNYPPNGVAKLTEIKQTILRRMIIEKLILQDAREKDINVSEDEVSRKIKSIKQNYTDDEFTQLLTNQFKTMEDWTAEIKQWLLIEKTLSREVIDRINVPEKEIKEYYDKVYANKMSEPKVKLEQIFTTNKESGDRILAELKAGANFEEMAKKYSEAPEAKNGGLIGYVTKGEGLEIFDKAFQMQIGEISELIQSDYGFHILKALEQIAPAQVSLNDARSFILDEMVRDKESKYYQEWLGARFKDARILKNTALIDSIK